MPDFDDARPLLPTPAWLLLGGATALGLLGIVGIYVGEMHAPAGPVNTLRQVAWLAASLIGFIATYVFGYQRAGRWAYEFYAVVLVLLVLLVVARKFSLEPFIRPRRNTFRWIELGPIQVQVSEVARVSCVLALARYLRFRSDHRAFWGLVRPALLMGVPTLLILLEPDLGTSLLFVPTLFVMLYVAGMRVRHLLLLFLFGAVAAPAFYFSPLMSNYQKKRVEAVLRQDSTDEAWHKTSGYQLRQSKIAIGSGGAFGEGLEQAAFFRHKLLPEDHNDFIFAVLAHQWGFVGATAILLTYLLLSALCLRIALRTPDPLGRLVAIGFGTLLGVQVFVNVGMTIGLLPITGMTLPFVSFGGSSLVVNYAALALIASVAARRTPSLAPRPFEFEDE